MATIKKIAEELNWKLDNNVVYGRYNEFDVTLLQNFNMMNSQDNYKLLSIPCESLSVQQISDLTAFYKERKKEMPGFQLFTTNALVSFRIIEAFKGLNGERLIQALSVVVEGFNKYGVVPQEHCIFCNQPESDTKTKLNKVLYPAHAECVEKAKVAQKEQEQQYDQKENNYLKGTIGAIFGAVIGTIPWILVDMFTGFFASILAVLIGYSAYFFYKKFGGKVTNTTKYIILVVTVLGIIFTNLVIASYIIVANDGLLVLENYIIVYSDPDISAYLLEDLFIGLVIGALGLITVYRKVKSEEYRKVVE